ncbi:hypothetical protein BKA93DRAFT_736443 [Sparassis latifolia]
MRTLAVISLFATVAFAQSSPLIPTGISTNCTDFLTSFNEDSSLTSCTSPLIKATAAFGPNGTADSTSSDVTTALSSVCSGASACSATTIQSKLASFYAACTDELTTSANAEVLRLYDVLYSVYPYTQALCTKDNSGNYCAAEIVTASSSAASASASGAPESLASIAKTLWSPITGSDSQSTIAIVPNATTFANSNILFLLLGPSLTSSQICTACTRNILTSYINFESNSPYGPGLTNSPLLHGQSALYTEVQSLCGASFLNGAVAAAGGLSGGILSGAAPRMASSSSGALGAMMGATLIALLASL